LLNFLAETQGGHDMENHDPRRRQTQNERPRDERSPRFSPDWSQQNAEPRYSDDPYYSRNREYQDDKQAQSSSGRDSNRGDGETSWRGDQNRTTTPEQRSHGSAPRDVAQSRDDERARSSARGLDSSHFAPEQRVYGARVGSESAEGDSSRTPATKPRH
jgi:hypothetical protein